MEIFNNENVQIIKLELEIENTGHVTNTYIIKDKKTSITCIIDPAFNAKEIIKKIEQIDGVLESVIITHSHADHFAALSEILEQSGVNTYIHSLDFEGLWDAKLNEEAIVGTKINYVNKECVNLVEENDVINIGETKLKVIHTPGHTIGSMCLLDELNNILYSGDTIFEKTYGRTDLITGSNTDMKKSLDKLMDMFEDILVYPGHGKIFNLKDSKRRIRLLFAYKG